MLLLKVVAPPIVILLSCIAIDEVPNGHEYGIGAGGSNWTTNVKEPVLGIDAASVSKITLYAGPPKGITFVVWSDMPNHRSGNGGGGPKEGAFYEGYHRATSGRRIDFMAETADGKKATLSIDGVSYDLTKGAFFLVSTQQEKNIVKQVAIDVTTVPTRQQQIFAFAKATDPIRDFFQKHQSKTLTPPQSTRSDK